MNTLLKQKQNAQSNGALATGSPSLPLPVAASPMSKTSGTDKPGKLDRVKMGITAYGASLVMTGVMIPFVASVVMVSLYLALPNVAVSFPLISLDPHSKWYAFVASSILTGILWFIGALLCCPFTRFSAANPRSYGLLQSRLCQLKANLGIKDADNELRKLERYADIKDAVEKIHSVCPCSDANIHSEATQAAYTDALACYIDIRKMLNEAPAGLIWVLGSGYINAWNLLHHAEEALIEFESSSEVVRGAIHDTLSIQGSALSGRDELLDKLVQAVTVLEPAAAMYFKEHQPKNCTLLDELAEAFKKKAIEEMLAQKGLEDGTKNKMGPKAEAMARVALREVRSTLNGFRDKSWESILRARNRLLAAIALTGTVTHILLGITILTSDVPTVGHPATALIAATAFYLIGAVTGLFGRFYRESVAGTATDDFGFSIARLVATPLLSGLAGIGGVLATVMFAALGGSALGNVMPSQVVLESIFRLDPRLLFAAAIFGLTPNLLIKGLQEKAQKFESDIQGSKAAEPAASSAKV